MAGPISVAVVQHSAPHADRRLSSQRVRSSISMIWMQVASLRIAWKIG